MPMPLRVLSLYQPAAYAVATRQKDVENRAWSPGPGEFQAGDLLAIHASKHKFDAEFATFARDNGAEIPSADDSAIVYGAVIAVVTLRDVVKDAWPSKWFTGPYGWLLGNIFAISPVPARGAPRIFTLDAGLESDVLAAYARAQGPCELCGAILGAQGGQPLGVACGKCAVRVRAEERARAALAPPPSKTKRGQLDLFGKAGK